MKHIYKSLNKILSIACLLSIGFADTNSTLLDSVSSTLHKEGGVVVDATIKQIQIENEWTDYVIIEIVDSTKFIFIGTDQIIKVDLDTIFTYTPLKNQVVVDHYFRDEFNMLSLLSGNLRLIRKDTVQKRKRDTIINFTIPQFESRGRIWINSITHEPLKIVMEDDFENQTNIIINSIEPMDIKNQYLEYTIKDWEVIDLREQNPQNYTWCNIKYCRTILCFPPIQLE